MKLHRKIENNDLISIFSKSDDFFIQLSPSLEIEYLNPSVCNFFKLPQPFHKNLGKLFSKSSKFNELFRKNTSELSEWLKTNLENPIEEKVLVNGDYITWKLCGSWDKHQELRNLFLIGKNNHELQTFKERDLESKFLSLIAPLPGNVYWMDKNCTHLGCNDNVLNMIGITREEYIGKTYEELAKIAGWKNKEVASFKEADLEVLRTGLPKLNIEEPPLKHKDGRTLYYLTTRVPLKNRVGETIGVAGISIDITERKKMEEELEQARVGAEAASKAKSEFIANMSHDIRTPITGILGLIQELIDVADNTSVSVQHDPSSDHKETKKRYLLTQLIEKVQEDGASLLGATDELLQFLNEILETMRLESGKETEQKESFNLRELVEHNVEIMKPVARHKQLELLYEIDEGSPTYFSGLRNYLSRSILNLLSNALKFTDKGFVKLRIHREDRSRSAYQVEDLVKLKLIVEDSGIGIPKDKFKTIFEHFSRLTPSYQGIYKGAGLGLYTVKQYVEAMGATIDVESEVSQGTRFIISLPLTISDHSDREKVSYRMPRLHQLSKNQTSLEKAAPALAKESSSVNFYSSRADAVGRVLVVEDNPLAAKMVQSNIRRTYPSSVCDLAENGQQAIAMAQEYDDYDFILMDIGLPDIEGTEVTKQIRALNAHHCAHVPILALTGHGNDLAKKEEALAAGMQEVLTKPLSSSVLEAVFQHYVVQTLFKPSASENPQTLTTVSYDTSVIDWAHCLNQCMGDKRLLNETLAILCADLKDTQDTLAKAYAAHDQQALRKELHRVHAGISYLSLPGLQHALAQFHEAVNATVPYPSHQLDPLYQQVQEAINILYDVLKKK